jgi:hypothetical protein
MIIQSFLARARRVGEGWRNLSQGTSPGREKERRQGGKEMGGPQPVRGPRDGGNRENSIGGDAEREHLKCRAMPTPWLKSMGSVGTNGASRLGPALTCTALHLQRRIPLTRIMHETPWRGRRDRHATGQPSRGTAGLDLRRTCSVRRKVRDPSTPGFRLVEPPARREGRPHPRSQQVVRA